MKISKYLYAAYIITVLLCCSNDNGKKNTDGNPNDDISLQRKEAVYDKTIFPLKVKSETTGGAKGLDNVFAVWDHPSNNSKIYFAEGSVVKFTGTAAVNAANEGCQGGGGIDGAFNNAGGPSFKKERKALETPGKKIVCPTGDALIIKSKKGSPNNSLKCDYVILAVGPRYQSFVNKEDEADKLLHNAYKSAIDAADAHTTNIDEIAFCLISSGIFRGKNRTLEDAIKIAIDSITKNIKPNTTVYIVAYSNDELNALKDPECLDIS